MSNKFYFASPNDSSTSLSSTSSDLPFPTALPRSDFLEADFNPSTYLTSLGHRHQTLEDLRSELRSRSQLLNQELLDLVNAHYADFLGLGTSLKGGEEKLQELRVGVLGFRRELENVKVEILKKEEQIQQWMEERKSTSRKILQGNLLLGLNEKLNRLEDKLMLAEQPKAVSGSAGNYEERFENSESSEDEDEDREDSDEKDDDEVNNIETRTQEIALVKLSRHTQDLKLINQISHNIGQSHPLIVTNSSRLARIRETLLSDAQSLLTQVKQQKDAKRLDNMMRIAAIYRDLKYNISI